MIESKRSHFTLFLLFPLAYLCADARFSTEPSLTPPPSSSSSSSAFHGSDLSFRIKVAALLCTFLFISIFSFYLNNWAASLLIDQENRTSAGVLGGGGGDDGRRRSLSRGIGREIIDTFPILVYSTIKNLKIGKGDLECAVCLSEFKDYETLRLIPKCNHVFHPECIDAWLASHATCPVCRANLNAENSGEVVADDGVPPPSPSTPLNADELVEENTQDNSGISETQAVSNGSESTINSRSDDADGSTMDDEAKAKRNRISRRPRWRMFGKLARSNSTGHSLVQNNTERHTLRLPEDVRRYILLNHSTIVGRCASYNVMMPMKGMGWSDSEGSSKGKRNYVERQDRWVLSATPPFVHRKD